jgi:predicted N-acetyltransferase YhbS
MLVNKGHERCEKLGYYACIVLGSNEFYQRFGYREAGRYGIFAPFQVYSKNYMVKELKKDSLKAIRGVVRYPKEFNV